MIRPEKRKRTLMRTEKRKRFRTRLSILSTGAVRCEDCGGEVPHPYFFKCDRCAGAFAHTLMSEELQKLRDNP